ncbi:MAG: hypothetical protein DDT31_01649 [Syntrophomonadaceae bacterium]|nr:hypothetical protein [Bacillota bacterium]
MAYQQVLLTVYGEAQPLQQVSYGPPECLVGLHEYHVPSCKPMDILHYIDAYKWLRFVVAEVPYIVRAMQANRLRSHNNYKPTTAPNYLLHETIVYPHPCNRLVVYVS